MEITVDKSHNAFNLYCPNHPNTPMAYFCSNEYAPQRLFCQDCADSYNNKSELIPAKDIKEKTLLTALSKASQQEGNESPEDMYRNIEQSYDQLKSFLVEMVENAKRQTLNNLLKAMPRKQGWNSMMVDLQKKYDDAFGNTVDPNSIEFLQFIRSYDNANKLLQNKDSESRVRAIIHKNEFDKTSKLIEEKFNSQKDKLVKLEQVQSQQRVVARFSLNRVTKDKVLKAENTREMKPTAITYLEGLEMLATSGNKDITLWDIRSTNKKQTLQNVHRETIVNLAFATKRHILISASYDRTMKFFKVNSKGIQGLVKTFTFTHGNAICGLLVLQDRNLLVGCGEPNQIKVWNLDNFGRVSTIKTGEHKDMGPKMAYSKRENLLAVYLYRAGKVGVYCMQKRCNVAILDTNLKSNDVFSLDLIWIEKNNCLITSTDMKKINLYFFKERRVSSIKEIEVQGYSMGFLAFEEEDYLLRANYLKDIHAISLGAKKVVSNIQTGLKNCVNLIPMRDIRMFAVPDMLSEKIALFKY